jgi:hypothetical protein
MLVNCRLERTGRRGNIPVRFAVPKPRAHDIFKLVLGEIMDNPPSEHLARRRPAEVLVIIRRVEVAIPDERRLGAEQAVMRSAAVRGIR